ncbi:MAG: hypothetical protein AAB621_03365 [Patescibacteria group bacterium]
MIFVIALVLVIGFFCAISAGVEMEKADHKGDGSIANGTSLVFALLFIVAGSIMMYFHGVGKLLVLGDFIDLKPNAVYETLSSVQDDGKYIVILRNDGQRIAYLLEKDPPSLFKYTGNPSNPYQLVIPVPITHINSMSNMKLK